MLVKSEKVAALWSSTVDLASSNERYHQEFMWNQIFNNVHCKRFKDYNNLGTYTRIGQSLIRYEGLVRPLKAIGKSFAKISTI